MQPIIEQIGKEYGISLAWLATFASIFLRYALLAGAAYYVVYVWKRRDWLRWKIQKKFPNADQLRREIGHSLTTAAIFASMAFGVFFLRKQGFGKLYFDISDYGMAYFVFSLVFVVLAHDTYFYWIHRLMHHPRLFKYFHLVHHQSTNPNPWTSLSFHPLEAVLEFGIIPFLAFVMPMHVGALLFFTIWSTVFNVFGHTGYEFSPSGFTQHWFWKWWNTPTHHNMHHQKSNCNYGLYFNIWDRIMRTNDKKYDQVFEDIKRQQELIKN
jgi:sterol desaturase/sphingolipid hydroxylase (fatty acid hydroxylase superfamily)